MLASWFHYTGRNWQVYVHDDGTLGAAHEEAIKSVLPSTIFVRKPDADSEMQAALSGYDLCLKARDHYAPSLKFFDAWHYSDEKPYLVIDTDILFYDRPDMMLNWTDGELAGSWFMDDLATSYVISPDEFYELAATKMWPKVNSGICMVQPGMIDLEFTERMLAESNLLKRRGWTHEQGFFAMNASRVNEGGRLPSDLYEITLGTTRNPAADCRHYVGAVRDQFYSEGIRHLKKCLLK